MSANDAIVQCAIYPGIGVARVGNSPDEFFLCPEVPGEVPNPPGGFKDAQGRIKRQGVRFRVYGLNNAGEVVKEITADDAEIEWRVHLANRKSAWYEFNNAMDLGEYAIHESKFRNSSIQGAARQALIIDPGSRTITGRNSQGNSYQFDSGEYRGIKVPLGELHTDDKGQLIVLGGYGHSASRTGEQATTFANNEDWYDDISDGPVRATVRMGSDTFEAEPAMVVVAPPNYGPGLYGVVTMYDVVFDLFSRELDWLSAPTSPSFWLHIYPILERLVNCQWVNYGIHFLLGESSPSDFTAPDVLAQLSDPSPAAQPLRTSVFRWFRNPDNPNADLTKIPPFYGDTFSENTSVGKVGLSVTRTQYGWLQQWAEGNFDVNPEEQPQSPPPLEQLPVAAQPDALNRAALEDCLGGPFHPGIEMTWTLRVASMWKSPFRLKILPEGVSPRDDYGPALTPEIALSPDGPLQASGPGTLTCWLGIPWQTDEASCDAGYEEPLPYLPLPSFWAARVPNHVLSYPSYTRLRDENVPVGQRLKHFNLRQAWLRYLGNAYQYQKRINRMVADWDKVGIVTQQPGPSDRAASLLPTRIWVETDLNSDLYNPERDATWQQAVIAEQLGIKPDAGEVVTRAEQRWTAAGLAMPPEHQPRFLGRGER